MFATGVDDDEESEKDKERVPLNNQENLKNLEIEPKDGEDEGDRESEPLTKNSIEMQEIEPQGAKYAENR